jgi:site-specific DNA recombinase
VRAGSAPLLGKFRDETGDPLTPTHTQRHGRRIRYYVSNRLISGKRDHEGWRLPAPAFERAVATAIADHLDVRATHHAILRDARLARAIEASASAGVLANRIRKNGVGDITPAIVSGTLGRGRMGIVLDATGLAEHLGLSPDDLDPALLSIDAPFTCRRRGVEMKILAGERERDADPTLLRALRHAHDWAARLKAGTPLREIARRADYSESYVARILPLATLSPKIQTAIVKGTQPVELTLETLVRARLPMHWSDQEKRFGFDF